MTLRRLHRWYQLSTAKHRQEGREWYPQARLEICELADTYNIPFGLVAGVVAVLSPSVRWDTNLDDAESVIKSWLYAEEYDWHTCRVSTYGRNKDKAFSMLKAGKVFPFLSGPKVVPFYYNLCGDFSLLTLDSHALNAWAGERIAGGKLGWTPMRVLRAARHDYVRAARKLGLPPAEFQATLWLYWKDRVEEGKVRGYER